MYLSGVSITAFIMIIAISTIVYQVEMPREYKNIHKI